MKCERKDTRRNYNRKYGTRYPEPVTPHDRPCIKMCILHAIYEEPSQRLTLDGIYKYFIRNFDREAWSTGKHQHQKYAENAWKQSVRAILTRRSTISHDTIVDKGIRLSRLPTASEQRRLFIPLGEGTHEHMVNPLVNVPESLVDYLAWFRNKPARRTLRQLMHRNHFPSASPASSVGTTFSGATNSFTPVAPSVAPPVAPPAAPPSLPANPSNSTRKTTSPRQPQVSRSSPGLSNGLPPPKRSTNWNQCPNNIQTRRVGTTACSGSDQRMSISNVVNHDPSAEDHTPPPPPPTPRHLPPPPSGSLSPSPPPTLYPGGDLAPMLEPNILSTDISLPRIPELNILAQERSEAETVAAAHALVSLSREDIAFQPAVQTSLSPNDVVLDEGDDEGDDADDEMEVEERNYG